MHSEIGGGARFFRVLLVAATAAIALLALAGTASAASGRYIVVLKDSVQDPGAVASDHGRRYGVAPRHVYRTALKGYAGAVPAGRLVAIRSDRRVEYVERDGVASIAAKPTAPKSSGGTVAAAQVLPWGIDRIDADISSTLAGNGSGTVGNVSAYVIDSGIDTGHSDLRVVRHVNFAGGKNTDCNGHGTHVAGTVAAYDNAAHVVGVAPGAPLTGVKVLGCSGSGSWSGVIAGVDWVTRNAQRPAVANMSLGGGASKAVDDAVRNSAAAGITYAVAAGNEGTDACTTSPARAGAGTNNGIVTVAATTSSNAETSWSNYGACVDIWAPGASILSTKRGGGTTTMSGTSMASPHVAGTAGLYLSANAAATPSQVETRLRSDAKATGTKSKNGASISLAYAGGY